MIYIFPDTNQWIYLANAKDPLTNNFQEGHHFHLLEKLNRLVDRGDVRIVINEIIEDEWRRNRAHAEEFIQKIRERKVNKIKQLKQHSGDLSDDSRKALEIICAEVEKKHDDEIEKNQEHIVNVEKLLAGADKFVTPDSVKVEVVNWGIAKKAPFIGDKKNSIADACILFGAVDQMSQKVGWMEGLKLGPKSHFVSGNINDFADPTNKNLLHPHLKPVTDTVEMEYFSNLAFALRAVDADILAEQEAMMIAEEMERLANENTGECMVCQPGEENVGLNNVRFGEPQQVYPEGYNPDQLELSFVGVSVVPVTIRTGSCDWCSTTHMECACGEVGPLKHIENRDVFSCEGCGLNYLYSEEYIGHGQFNEHFSLVPKVVTQEFEVGE